MKNFDFKNFLLVLCSIGAGLAELLAHYAFTGGALPLHLTAGVLLLTANAFGLIGKSILAPKPVTVAQLTEVVQAKVSPVELGARVEALPILPPPPAVQAPEAPALNVVTHNS